MQAAAGERCRLRRRAEPHARRVRGGRRARAALRAGRRPGAGEVLGYRSSGTRAVLLAAAPARRAAGRRRAARASWTPTASSPARRRYGAAAGLRPDDLLFVGCAAAELPNAAVVAVSEFYSLNRALVPQHVVFEIDADELGTNDGVAAAHARRRARDGLPALPRGLGAQFTSLELIAEAQPGLPVPGPGAGRRAWASSSPPWTWCSCSCASATVSARSSSPPAYARRDQARTLSRNGVELFCGELYARPDTRLPSVSFPG